MVELVQSFLKSLLSNLQDDEFWAEVMGDVHTVHSGFFQANGAHCYNFKNLYFSDGRLQSLRDGSKRGLEITDATRLERAKLNAAGARPRLDDLNQAAWADLCESLDVDDGGHHGVSKALSELPSPSSPAAAFQPLFEEATLTCQQASVRLLPEREADPLLVRTEEPMPHVTTEVDEVMNAEGSTSPRGRVYSFLRPATFAGGIPAGLEALDLVQKQVVSAYDPGETAVARMDVVRI